MREQKRGFAMNLSWYLARLRSMEAAEVMHRVVEKSRKITSRHQHQGWERYSRPDLHSVFPGLARRVQAASSMQRAAIEQASKAILAGQYQALGRHWPHVHDQDLFPQSLWRLDPVTGQSWPGSDTYCFDIDFRHDGARGDVKYVWEINRLQFLVVLSAHFALTEHTPSLAAVEAAISSWHAANPPFGGVSWASGIEVALRAISLVLVVEIVGTHLAADVRTKVIQILAASAFWLARFPSRFSSANNHLVAELAGEYLIARALGKAGSASWTALLGELEKQILPDGGGAEQTPSYAAFTAELVLIAALAAPEAGEDLPPSSSKRLSDFNDFLGWIGPGARFGDDDEGRVVTIGDEVDYRSSVAAAIAAFLGKASPVGQVEDFRALIFGVVSAEVAIPQGLRTFEATGLSVWRGEMEQRQVTLRFDHGPLGYLSIAAHGHADALAISLDLDGQPVLVDPGTFLYGSGGAWRDWFRSTPSHNTLNLGASQSVMSGAFNWSHKASARLLNQSNGADWELAAEHDGYEKRFGVRHRRMLKREGASVAICDCLIGKAQEGEIVFQLAPGLQTQSDGDRVLVSSNGQPLIEITLPDENFEIRAGGNSPGEGGWVSNRFGSKLPAARIAWRGKIDETGVWSRVSVLPH
jgi:hypothetical protein